MKRNYLKPIAEYIEYEVSDEIMAGNVLIPSIDIGEDDSEEY